MLEPHSYFQKRKIDLPSNEVHLWHISLENKSLEINTMKSVLSLDERSRANRFHFKRDQERFILSHGILRRILSQYSTGTPSKQKFRYNRYNKPFLDGQESLFFNLSHSEDRVLIGLTHDRQIGVDIECIRAFKDLDLIINSQFSKKERIEFSTLESHHKKKAFIKCWTRKEAYLKGRGEGLAFPLNQFSVSFLPKKKAQLTETLDDSDEKNRWDLREIEIEGNYIAAVAVKEQGLFFRNWKYI